MRIALAGNVTARGLEKDRKLLTPILESLGHSVHFVQYDEPHEGKYDLLIALEVVSRHLAALSDAPPLLLVNPEWMHPQSVKIVKQCFGRVLCKTQESYRICKELFGGQAAYTGFVSEDRYEPKIERAPTFLHIAGQSQAKNTQAIIDAWRWKKNGSSLYAKLFVVSDFPVDDVPENVTLLKDLSDEELKRLQNSCIFHLQPSATEGFGHVLHEAMSVNANILTVDAPPMNEVDAAYRIPATGHTLFNAVKMYEISALDVFNAVDDLLILGHRGFGACGMPRKEFLAGNEAFKAAFAEHLKERKPTVSVPRTRSGKQSIAFCGNFEAEHSTENQILWALEQGLGYEVEKLQENRVTVKQIYEACSFSQILIWVRTPGWLQIPDDEMFKLLEWCKNEGVKTLSVHLDKFFGIPEREFLIGRIPFWKTQFVFTADGSRQEDFKERGVNHFWMRPAVSEVYCHPGTPREEYYCDVGFVGAKEYHSEYPFRRQMVEFLEETYGPRFKHIQGLRGHGLNDFYESCSVVVGDCFGAGIENYWSDRVPETCGRHGFLLHPKVKGLTLTVATYEAQNLENLKWQIDYWLSHEKERLHTRRTCARVILERDTWSRRMREILETIAK